MHHTCGALRTMRSMQRTPHIVRRLVLGVQHAACNMQHATRSVQHAPRPIATAAMRPQKLHLRKCNMNCAASSVQHANRKHATHNLHTHTIPATRTIRRAQVLVRDNLQQPTYNMQH